MGTKLRAFSEVSKLLKRAQNNNRAVVSLCYAQSLNGTMAGAISGHESMVMTHHLRRCHDAILIGINTLIKDDSQLTTRLVSGKNPVPIILDSHLKIPLESKLSHRNETIIFKDQFCEKNKEKEEILRERGLRIIPCPKNEMGLDLNFVARTLKSMGLNNLMVEGGSKVLNSFVKTKLFDNYFLTVASNYGESDIRIQDMDLNLPNPNMFQLGEDLFLSWSKQYEETPHFVETLMPTKHGNLMMRKYRTGEICMYSEFNKNNYVPVRIHSSCITSEVFGSLRCDCTWQLEQSLKRIHQTGGIVVYLNQEGRGIGLSDKLRAYNLQETKNLDTVEANMALGHEVDYRDFESCLNILKSDFQITKLNLLTNNPDKLGWAKNHFDLIHETLLPPEDLLNRHREMAHYLETKHEKLAHFRNGKNGWVHNTI